jgi:hypothetical protein
MTSQEIAEPCAQMDTFRLWASIDVPSVFNAVEAAVWLVVAAILTWASWRRTGRIRAYGAVAALSFAAFAASDVVEIQTGAWYRPLWLLAWKAACIATLAVCYYRWRQSRGSAGNG